MNNEESKIRLLLVEDDEDFGPALISQLARRKFDTVLAKTGEEGLAKLGSHRFDIVVSDIKLPEMDGMEFLAKAKELKPDLPVILLTGYGSLESAKEAVKLDASDYLLKPLESIDDLLNPINKAMHSYRLRLKNKKLEKEIVEIGENECRRIGRDLHDGVCQYLAGIGMMAKELEMNLAAKSLPEAETAAKITSLLRHATAETRLLAEGLCPINLDEDGLTTALGTLASDVKKIFDVSCVFKCGDSTFVDYKDVAIHLYRIAQEAINNAIKHGKASEVLVSLDTVRGRTVLTVKDNGKGSPDKIGKNTGMGSHILRHRAEMINASLDIQRPSTGGTVLVCSIGSKAPPEKTEGE